MEDDKKGERKGGDFASIPGKYVSHSCDMKIVTGSLLYKALPFLRVPSAGIVKTEQNTAKPVWCIGGD